MSRPWCTDEPEGLTYRPSSIRLKGVPSTEGDSVTRISGSTFDFPKDSRSKSSVNRSKDGGLRQPVSLSVRVRSQGPTPLSEGKRDLPYRLLNVGGSKIR